jgi:hypothetical protein
MEIINYNIAIKGKRKKKGKRERKKKEKGEEKGEEKEKEGEGKEEQETHLHKPRIFQTATYCMEKSCFTHFTMAQDHQFQCVPLLPLFTHICDKLIYLFKCIDVVWYTSKTYF